MSDTVIVIQKSVQTLEVNPTGAEIIEVSTPGVPGPTGIGVPAGGITGQVLKKNSNADYDTSWQAPGAAPTAAQVSFTPAGNIAASDVQAALEEVDTEKAALASAVMDGDTAGGVLAGTYPNPSFASDMATQAELDAHLNDTTDAHDASAISSVAAGNLAATDVQAALNELDSEKAALASAVMDGDAAGGVLAGTYPNPSFASDMATQAELDAHISDSSAAHAASAVSVDSTTLSGVGTDVQASLEELDNLLDAHHTRHENGGADEISVAGLSGQLADPQPTDASLVDSGPASNGQVLTADGLGGSAWSDPGAASTPALVDLTDVTGAPPNTGEAPVWDGDSFELTNIATQTELDAVAAAKQDLDSDLTAIAALAPTNDDIIQRKAGAWTNRTMAQLIADLAALGTTFQPLDSDLTSIAALSTTAFGRALLALADPSDATKFLDGTGVYDTVKDSDLSTSDITTNNVSTIKHGFAPKLPNDATKFLDGTGAYSVPVASTDGWISAGETWTYASSTTFTVSGDQTAKYTKGTRIKLTQTTVKYFVVTGSSYSSPNTTVTITGGSDYTLANAAISANYYSHQANPQGYPGYFAYAPTYTGFSSDPSGGVSRFAVIGTTVFFWHTRVVGTSNSSAFTITLPVNCFSTSYQHGRALNNGSLAATPGLIAPFFVDASHASLFRDGTGLAWTSSGNKNMEFVLTYEMA